MRHDQSVMRVGIVGAGPIGHKHALAYANHTNTIVSAVCDRDPVRLKGMTLRWQCAGYGSVQEMLQHEQLDMVSVATGGNENGSHHFEPTREVLLKGIPVLCEKPLSNSLEEARVLVSLAREKNVALGVNLNRRFVPFATRAKDWVANSLGQPLLINFTLWIDNPVDSSEWYHLRALHCHSIDLMQYFCGPVRQVQMFAARFGTRVCWSNIQINLLFESGVLGHLTGSYDMSRFHDIERCEIVGERGRILLENCFEKLTFFPRHSPETTVLKNCIRRGIKGFDDTFNLRIHRWIEQIQSGVNPENIEGSGAESLRSQEVIEAAISSWKAGGMPVDVTV